MPGQHQQEGRGGSHGLAGVEQRPSHPLVQRVRLIQEDDQRSMGAAQGQQLGQRARVAAQLPAESSDADGNRQGVREQRPEAGRRHQGRSERIQARQIARGAPYDVDLPGGLDLALEPAQQHCLAVAAGARQHGLPRCPSARLDIGEQPHQLMLLGIPAGQKGRQHPSTGDEGIDGWLFAHGRTIADEEHRARRRRRNAGEPALYDIRPGVALARAASLILVTPLSREPCTIRRSTCSGPRSYPQSNRRRST